MLQIVADHATFAKFLKLCIGDERGIVIKKALEGFLVDFLYK